MSDSTTPLNTLNLQSIFGSAVAGFGVAGPLCVAVSGGADSMALLHLATGWAAENGADLYALTVDHGLRKEAAAEAEMVAAWCAENSVPHSILRWNHNITPDGNLQAEARLARYRLMGEWCSKRDCNVLLTAHHSDDQAETVLMRLMRGSGVDGLAAMAPGSPLPVPGVADDLKLFRPLLGVRRASLRDYAFEHALPFVDDPSNEDTGFDRVAVRRAVEMLGMDVPRLARTAQVMQAEQQALNWAMAEAAKTCIEISPHGFVGLNQTALGVLPPALATRLARRVVRAMGNAAYPPPRDRLERFTHAVLHGHAATLAGLAAAAGPDGQSLIFPEQPPAAMLLEGQAWQNWDARFAFNSGGEKAEILPRAALSATALGDEITGLLSGLPAAVRPSVPVLRTPDGTLWLPSFGLMPSGMRIELTIGHMFSAS